jgi:hypothetical protein
VDQILLFIMVIVFPIVLMVIMLPMEFVKAVIQPVLPAMVLDLQVA